MIVLLLWLLLWYAPPTKYVTVQVPCDATAAGVQVSVGNITVKQGQGLYVLFQPTSGVAPFTFFLQSPLPAGLFFGSDGTIVGTPTVTGSYPYQVECRDAQAAT